MTHARYSDKRDANEAEIIAWLRERGCRVVQMPRGAGYDLQVFAPGGYILPPIEVKNPRYAWQYEKAEADLMVWCHDNGVAYLTITSIDEIQEYLSKPTPFTFKIRNIKPAPFYFVDNE